MSDPVIVDDLHVPTFSPEVEEMRGFMAAMANDCPLDAEVLHAKARAETGLHDFGPDDYRERLGVLLTAVADIGGCTGRAS